MPTSVVLQSWKEISAYVGRTDRTLQRWERKFGFPVHRPSGKSRSAVVAVVSEIEEWMRATPSLRTAGEIAEQNPLNPSFSATRSVDIVPSIEANKLRLRANIEQQRNLRNQQRILLQQQRKLRRQHRNAMLAVIRLLDSLAS